MKQTRIIMNMPIIVEVNDKSATEDIFEKIYDYFHAIENKFSIFKKTSEISRINRGEIDEKDYSDDMKTIFRLAKETKNATMGYFDIKTPKKTYNPSGIVKGWAILQASKILDETNFQDYYVEAGGDIQVHRQKNQKTSWQIGIRNPFETTEIIKVLNLKNEGIATSGTSIRGQHIYNPHNPNEIFDDVISITVVGPNVYEADRFATAAFGMGNKGIDFIEDLKGFEGYAVNKRGIATITSGFNKYTKF